MDSVDCSPLCGRTSPYHPERGFLPLSGEQAKQIHRGGLLGARERLNTSREHTPEQRGSEICCWGVAYTELGFFVLLVPLLDPSFGGLALACVGLMELYALTCNACFISIFSLHPGMCFFTIIMRVRPCIGPFEAQPPLC